MQLKQQTAVITGASSGIGRAIALAFAQQGANLILHTKSNQAGLEETVTMAKQHGIQCTQHLADLTCAESREQFVQSVFETGKINIWINNAGTDILTNENAKLSFTEKLQLLWAMDVHGTIEICQIPFRPSNV